jgi:hypothetical protein
MHSTRENFALLNVFKLTSTLLVPAVCDYTRAMLLTYDCEIDKPGAQHFTAALIRPLDPLPEEQKEIIRGNRSFPFFHLPSGNDDLLESYVDFRRQAVVSEQMVQSAKRLGSLADQAWKAMLFQLVRYWTRLEIDFDRLDRPSQ